MKRKNRMVYRLLWYYLAILIIPTITTTIIYLTTREALLDVQKEKAYVALTDAVNQFEQDITGIRNIATYLSTDTTIGSLARNRVEDKGELYYNMYKSCDEFPKYTLTNSMIGDICVWFSNQPYILSMPGVIPKDDRGISSISVLNGEAVEELDEFFCGEYHYLTMDYQGGGDSAAYPSRVRMIDSVSSTTDGHYDAAVIISFDNDVINSLLKSARSDADSGVFLMDKDQNIVRGFTSNGEKIDSGSQTTWEEYKEMSNIEYKAYTCQKKSEATGWSFVVVTPVDTLIAEIGSVKYFTGFLYILSILTGCIICIYYWYHNGKMVDRYCEFAEKLPTGAAQGNKRQSFWKSFGSFLDQLEIMQNLINKQQEIIREESIQKLLFGKYKNASEFEEENKVTAALMQTFQGFYVAILRFENQTPGEFLISDYEIREKMNQLFEEKLPVVHWNCTVDSLTYALILADDGKWDIFAIKELLADMCQQPEGVSGVFIGVSQRVHGVMELNVAYDTAMEICKSASFFQIHVPLVSEEREEELHGEVMTLEQEYQFEQTLLRGTENELEALLVSFRESNMEQLQHRYWLPHMIHMIQCILIRCLKKENDEWSRRMVDKVQKAEWPDELFLLLRTSKRYKVNVEEGKRDRYLQETKEELEHQIDAAYTNVNFNLAILAETMQMGEQKLYKEFKMYFGMTFSDYLEKIRIQKAEELLRQGVAVKDVAERVGYGSDYSFRRAFKRNTGMTPTSYMKM
jgi:two-component system response regulator YesN